jgi:hypothetical protein
MKYMQIFSAICQKRQPVRSANMVAIAEVGRFCQQWSQRIAINGNALHRRVVAYLETDYVVQS